MTVTRFRVDNTNIECSVRNPFRALIFFAARAPLEDQFIETMREIDHDTNMEGASEDVSEAFFHVIFVLFRLVLVTDNESRQVPAADRS